MAHDIELAKLERLLTLCIKRKNLDSQSDELKEKLRILCKDLPHISEEKRVRWLEEKRRMLPEISAEKRARWLEEKRHTLKRK